MTDEQGASGVEYGLLIVGIAAVIAVAVFAFANDVQDLFGDTCASVASQTAADCS